MNKAATLILLSLFVATISAITQSASTLTDARGYYGELAYVSDLSTVVLYGGLKDASMTWNTNAEIYHIPTKTKTQVPISASANVGAEAFGDAAYFFGGLDVNFNLVSRIVKVNVTSKTVTVLPQTLSHAGTNAAAHRNKNVIFVTASEFSSPYSPAVDFFNVSATGLSARTTFNLRQGRYYPSIASAGNLTLFAGGIIDSDPASNSITTTADVEFFDYNTRQLTTYVRYLSKAVGNLATATVGDYIYFAGGQIDYTTYSNDVEIYNSLTGVFTVVTNVLSQRRGSIGIAVLNNHLILAGGESWNNEPVARAQVDVFNVVSRTLNTTFYLPSALSYSGGAAYSNAAYFFGGISYSFYNGVPSNAVNIFTY